MSQKQGRSVLDMSQDELVAAVRRLRVKVARVKRQRNKLKRELMALKRSTATPAATKAA